MIRKCLKELVKEIKLDCNNAIAIRVDKSVFDVNKDVVFLAAYIAPEGGPIYEESVIKDGVVLFEESEVQQFQRKDFYYIVCGDFNSRTGCEQPCIEEIDDMMNYDIDPFDHDIVSTDNFMKRCSKDHVISDFGKSFLDLCFLLDLVILNGFCHGDMDGDFTFVAPQ